MKSERSPSFHTPSPATAPATADDNPNPAPPMVVVEVVTAEAEPVGAAADRLAATSPTARAWAFQRGSGSSSLACGEPCFRLILNAILARVCQSGTDSKRQERWQKWRRLLYRAC